MLCTCAQFNNSIQLCAGTEHSLQVQRAQADDIPLATVRLRTTASNPTETYRVVVLVHPDGFPPEANVVISLPLHPRHPRCFTYLVARS
jgi:hypothetical protein